MMVASAPAQTTRYRRWGKSAVDRTLALLLLVPAAPVMLVVAVAALAFQGRPILFRQIRPGLREQPFALLKFRTMTAERGAGGSLLPDGQRLTSFGRWLRRTSLDEAPQLINVLRGELSLVGPRPLLVEYLPRYSEQQRRRHDVKPGITGLAQVSGRNALDWATRLRLDVEYVERCSLRLDSWIMARTLLKVVTGEGIADGRTATSEPFTGQR
jgi:lipopolysaccharide/colanic/teichoic acid biosynthesis glycosyltransferase